MPTARKFSDDRCEPFNRMTISDWTIINQCSSSLRKVYFASGCMLLASSILEFVLLRINYLSYHEVSVTDNSHKFRAIGGAFSLWPLKASKYLYVLDANESNSYQ
ncbi:hypothetical protein AVEN_258693-1 [Araneus ventricosus]|uniref:Uncharacterized protein n=1 Tax=Araneus ventricosus TaxID=182803 RepID=A0A4Y1ZU75_ARAVE|nr:hypothetical protein AVEN_233121-1 [Araneus ventricosus]GBL68362.1 hypothetical protein AVEN_258693-1 [Araneus ventricosus]